MTSIQCFSCIHYIGGNENVCEAFRDGIPDDIFTGNISHDYPIPNQGNRVVFQEKS